MKRIRKQIFGLLLCLAILAGYFVFMHRPVDRKPPVITVPEGELAISVSDDPAKLLEGVTAFDETDGDVTAGMVVEGTGTLTGDFTAQVTYAAFDRAGNVAKATRPVHFTDYTGMRFELTGPLVFSDGRNFDITDFIRVHDPLDGDLTGRLKANLVDGEYSVSTPGHHEVELRATNSLGYTGRLTVPVDVYAAGEYNASVELSQYIVYLHKGEAFDPGAYPRMLAVSSRLRYPLMGAVRPETELTVSSDVDVSVPGVYTVRYEARHGTSRGFANLVVVVEE